MNAEPRNMAAPYKDNPSIFETYVDGIHMLRVEPNVARITMTVSRWDESQGGLVKTRKVTAARIVMPASVIVDLYNQLHRVMLQMEENGSVSRIDGQVQVYQ